MGAAPGRGQGKVRARDGEGRRPRHRQEHRRRRPRLQQLRGARPRRDGAGADDPRHGARAGLRHRRPLRADHAVARRDGRRRARDGAARPRPAAHHRRGDDLAPAHGGEGGAGVRRTRRCTSSTPRASSASSSALLDPERRADLDAENRVDQERLRAVHAARDAKPLLRLEQARARRTPIEWRADDLAVPALPRPAADREPARSRSSCRRSTGRSSSTSGS